MLKPFLKVHSAQEAREQLRRFNPLDTEDVSLDDALYRVLAQNIKAAEDMPGFDRSTMDGFAVRSRDTFGATETSPALLSVVGEISMGRIHDLSVKRGETVRIWTGGALPSNADAVVMVEYAEELDAHTIEVLKAVAPFDNMVRRGEDFKAGETLLKSGQRLRPPDLGLLAAMGVTSVRVYRRVAVAIISSGDEIVPIDTDPPAGCVRDINRHTLAACTKEAQGDPVWIGIAPDRLADLSLLIDRGLNAADLVIISGGSSMGSRDLVIEAIQAYEDSAILLHGVSVSPGKPFILARVGTRPVVGLPGHPVSAMVCFEQFVEPLIRRLEGEDAVSPFLRPSFQAFLSRNVPSKEGRLDFLRVRLTAKEGRLTAVPVPGKSGMISSMVRAHGYIRIEPDCEGLYKGDQVNVHLYSHWIEEDLETQYLSGHEAAPGGARNLFATPVQEKLSRT
jgi:molybdopterin molybdotransferase